MSVSSTTTKVQFAGDAASSVFPFNSFSVYAASELLVSIKNNTTAVVAGIAAKTIVTLVLGTDYTVVLNGSQSGVAYTGTVTVVNPLYTNLPVGLILVIQRVLPQTQLTTLADNNNTPASTYQQVIDRAVMLIQQLQELLNRAVVFDITQVTSPTLPPLSAGALSSDGVSLAWQALVTTATTYGAAIGFGADASKAASPSLGSLYFATDTRKVYFCSSAGTWGYGYTLDINTLNGVIFAQQGAGIATSTNQLGFYTKAVSGQPELFFRLSSSGTEVQLTKAGTWNAAAFGNLANIPPGAGIIPAANIPPNQAAFETKLLHIRDEKAANTNGGTFTSGAWRTRDLNTVKTNEITGASLASNQITLPAGTYFIRSRSQVYGCNYTSSRLRNITDGSDVIIGSVTYANNSTGSANDVWVTGRFTLAAQKVLEIQGQCSTTIANYGFGNPGNFGVVEVYSDVLIWKVA